MAETPSNQEALAPMKSRVLTFTSLLAVVIAMLATTSAVAQTSPAQDVYNPRGEVLDVVQGGGSDTADTAPAGGGDSDNGNTTPTQPVSRESGADAPATTPAVSSGELQFTGFEAGLVAVAGLALLGAGVAMRRVARNDTA